MRLEDLERSYRGTWLGFREDDVISPVYVEGVRERDAEKCLVVARNDSLDAVPWNDSRLVYEYPDLGMVPLEDKVFWLERVPHRQWHKGIKPQLVNVQELGGRKLRLDHLPTSTVLHKVYNPEYPSNVSKYAALIDGWYWYKGLRVVEKENIHELQIPYLRDYLQSLDLEEI